MAKTIKVFKEGNVWIAQKEGTKRASAIRNTQKEAYLAARNIALNQGLTITLISKGKKRVINPRNKTEEDNCFITTACIKYYGFNDNCYQLKTLREFRDTYLLKSIENMELVKQYYSIAPVLVRKLEADGNKKKLFSEIFIQINQACKAIEENKLEKATSIYKETVSRLINHYELF